MASLSVDYERARIVGNNLSNKAAEFLKLLNEIEATNNTLAENWLGADATEYTNAIKRHAEEQKQLQKSVDEAGNFTTSAGNTYQRIMEENKNNIITSV